MAPNVEPTRPEVVEGEILVNGMRGPNLVGGCGILLKPEG